MGAGNESRNKELIEREKWKGERNTRDMNCKGKKERETEREGKRDRERVG